MFKDGINVRVLHIRGGEETSFHCHMHKDVLMILLRGRARMKRGNSERMTDYLEDLELKPMFVRQIPKTVFHQTMAIDDAVVIEIESTGDINDLVRGEDKYGRKQGYEAGSISAIDDIVDRL